MERAAPAAGPAGRPATRVRIIAGRWRGRLIDAPAGRTTRPTGDRVREAWMSALQFQLEDSRLVDLFAGSGALGLEALSRGAAHVTFVETGGRALAALRANIEKLGATEQSEIVRRDVLDYVTQLVPDSFDIALADPPWREGAASRLVERFGEQPFAGSLWVEHGIREALPSLPGARTRRYGATAITSIPAST